MPELVRQREALPRNRLPAVDEQHRTVRLGGVCAGNPLWQVDQEDVRPASLLDDLDQVRQRAFARETESLASLPRPLGAAV
jgi:hypothetical protein